MQPTLFQRALGAAFFRLPDSLRQLHGPNGGGRYAGMATVERGSGLLARLCAWAAGLPKAGRNVPLAVEIVADARGETWLRDFAGFRMVSRLALKDGLLQEWLGPVRFRFVLVANDGAIWWTVAGARLFGFVPLSASLFDGVRCREYQEDDRYCFEVEATLPLAGKLIRYAGWLERAPG